MKKLNWLALLEAEIRRSSTLPFEWGTHDCALFVCNCILAMTGDDPATAFRNQYDDEESAYTALTAFAGGGLLATAEKITGDMGFLPVMASFAQRGDIAICALPAGDTLGIIALNGREVLVASKQGIITAPIASITHAWRVE